MIFYFTGTGNSLYAAKQLDPELISSFGEIRGRPEQKERARLLVELTDGVHERRETLWVQVCPLSETETEHLLEALREQIRQADLQNPEEGTVRLPDQLEGKALRYRQADTAQYQLFPVLGVSAAAILVVGAAALWYGRRRGPAARADRVKPDGI